MSDCIVIAVLIGIEISHKLFTPEMVADALAILDSGTVLGLPLCHYTTIHSCGLQTP